MAKKNAQETEVDEPVVEPVEESEPDLEYREKPIFPKVTVSDDDESEVDQETAEEVESASLTPEQREQRRLAKKPKIDHLQDGTATLDDGTILPLFDVGDTIIAERHISFAADHPWLDTRLYTVRSIDDEKGIVHCTDVELVHYACIGFKHPHTRIKLAPKRGNPFKAPKVEKVQVELPPGEKKKRGRPKGSKNRPKDVIKAEKQARKEGKAA